MSSQKGADTNRGRSAPENNHKSFQNIYDIVQKQAIRHKGFSTY